MADMTEGDIQAAIGAGREQTIVHTEIAPSVALVAQPMGAVHHLVDLEQYDSGPRRARHTVSVRDVESFSALVNKHKTDSMVAYAHLDGEIVAVVNDDELGAPGWRDHRIVLQRPHTKAFDAWMSAFEAAMSQQAFARFLEDRLTEIAEPAGADLLEIAQEFSASRSLKFRSQKKLANGQQQVEYVEELEGGGGREGKITLPEQITVVVSPYRDSEPITIRVRLRWTLADQAVRFTLVPVEGKSIVGGVEIAGLQDTLDALNDQAIEAVIAQTGVLVVRGHE